MAECPALVTDRKQWGCCDVRIASTAILRFPSVPFLNPTGHERPDASSRWSWLSVVRAPTAPQLTRSEMYCGEIMSRNSTPAGMPRSFSLRSNSLAMRTPSLILKLPSRRIFQRGFRIVDGARPYSGQQPVIGAMGHTVHVSWGFVSYLSSFLGK